MFQLGSYYGYFYVCALCIWYCTFPFLVHLFQHIAVHQTQFTFSCWNHLNNGLGCDCSNTKLNMRATLLWHIYFNILHNKFKLIISSIMPDSLHWIGTKLLLVTQSPQRKLKSFNCVLMPTIMVKEFIAAVKKMNQYH